MNRVGAQPKERSFTGINGCRMTFQMRGKNKVAQMSSIGSLLVLSYLSLSLIGFLAVFFAWKGLQRIDQSGREVSKFAIPLLVNAFRLSDASTRFVNLTNDTPIAETTDQLSEYVKAVSAARSEVESNLSWLRSLDLDDDRVRRISGLFSEILSNYDRSIVKVRDRLTLNRQLNELDDALEVAFRRVQTDLNVQSYQSESDINSGNIDNSSTDIPSLFSQIELMRITLSRAILAESEASVLAYKAGYIQNMRSLVSDLNRGAADLFGEAAKQEISLLLDQLNSQDSGVFPLKARELAIIDELDDLTGLNTEVSETLQNNIAELVALAERFVAEQYKNVESEQRSVVTTLTVFDVVLVLFPLGAVFLFIRPKLLKRLNYLSSATDEIARGQLDAKIETSGNDEISGLAVALEQFRSDLLEKRQA